MATRFRSNVIDAKLLTRAARKRIKEGEVFVEVDGQLELGPRTKRVQLHLEGQPVYANLDELIELASRLMDLEGSLKALFIFDGAPPVALDSDKRELTIERLKTRFTQAK